jgi:hypothetical protein
LWQSLTVLSLELLVGESWCSPHKSLDPVLIPSQIVVSLQTIVSIEIDPIDAVVVTHAASYRFDLVVGLSNEYQQELG